MDVRNNNTNAKCYIEIKIILLKIVIKKIIVISLWIQLDNVTGDFKNYNNYAKNYVKYNNKK